MKKKSSFHLPFILCACAGLLSLAGCDLFTSPEKRLARAEQLIAQGDYSEAAIEIKIALDKDPGNPRALLSAARVSMQQGRFDATEKALSDARSANAPAAELDLLGAQLMLARGQHGRLLTDLDSGMRGLSAEQRTGFRARALSAAGRCTEALPLTREILARDPELSFARILLADCMAKRGNGASALRELEAAAARNDSEAPVWLALGGMRRAQGDKPGAEQAWHKAVATARGQLSVPQLILIHTSLAELQIERGDTAALRATHAALLAVAPDNVAADYLGANVELLAGKAESAARTLQALLAAYERFRPARVLLTSALLAQNNFEQARQHIAVLAADASSSASLKAAAGELARLDVADAAREDHWIRLAAVHAALGQPVMARAALDKALAIAPQSRVAAVAIAHLQIQTGDVAAALTAATGLAKAHPEDPQVMSLLAHAQTVSGDHRAAAATLETLQALAPTAAYAMAMHMERTLAGIAEPQAPLERWLATHPNDIGLRMYYAESLRAAGDQRRAAAEFETVLAQNPRQVVALNNLAWVYHLLGDPRAGATSRRAFELAPKVAAVADTHGWILVESGATQEGLDVLRSADQIEGDTQPEIRYHYAAALARTGERDQARKLLEDLLANAPDFPSKGDASKLLLQMNPNPAT